MALKEYEVPGVSGRTITVLLDDETAERYGDRAKLVQAKAAPKPANKSRSAQNKK